MLQIENLTVSINGKKILKEIELEIKERETVVLLGPNGCGKTTLLMTIMGIGGYKIESGKIIFKKEDITNLPTNERVKLGIGMMFQRPPTVSGVTVRQLIEICCNGKVNAEQLADKLEARGFLDRAVNEGFSGGEIKRSELLQLMAQAPDLVLLDEPESGVDMENIALIGSAINELLARGLTKYENGLSVKEHHRKSTRSGLIITHTGYILDYVPTDRGIVFIDGHVVCIGNPMEILNTIRHEGFDECKRCDKRRGVVV
jgi:Fe-S cluster assembly ATP-binding protein